MPDDDWALSDGLVEFRREERLHALRHGGPVEEPPQDVFLSDDPAVGMVRADMGAWLQAHPCDCHALCECDAGPQTDRRDDG